MSIQRNHYDQWELAAFRHYDERLAERNMQRVAEGKHPVRAQRLPESAYKPINAATFCQGPATCRLGCEGCPHVAR